MYYVLFTKIEETKLVGLFFTKGVLEFVVKILDTYTYKLFLFLSKTGIVNMRIPASNN